MTDLTNELNEQLRAIHARLDRVDTDLASHFAAQYLQAISFSANPLTATQGALMIAQFASRPAFTALASQVPGYSQFKQLQHLEASSLLQSLASNLTSIASGILTTAASQLQTAAAAQIAASVAYSTAVQSGADQVTLASLQSTLDSANAALNSANQALNNIGSFLGHLTNLANGQTISSVIRR